MIANCQHHFLIYLLTVIDCVISLKLLELRVPPFVPLGSRAQLLCRWQLGSADVLYSVKWYKDGKEFFRHVPRDVEPRRNFPLPGVCVEKSDSFGSNIILSDAVSETSGRYRCEVSGERPLFRTVSDHADMEVIILPNHGPILSGLQQTYQIGDQVRVNCTSGRSRPPIHLSWYINGEPAPITAVSKPVHRTYEDQFKTTSIILKFKVTDDHLNENEFKVKCLATFATIYWESNEESAVLCKEKVYNTSESILQGTYIWTDRVHSNLAHMPRSYLIDAIIITEFLLCIRLRY